MVYSTGSSCLHYADSATGYQVSRDHVTCSHNGARTFLLCCVFPQNDTILIQTICLHNKKFCYFPFSLFLSWMIAQQVLLCLITVYDTNPVHGFTLVFQTILFPPTIFSPSNKMVSNIGLFCCWVTKQTDGNKKFWQVWPFCHWART